MLLIKDVCGGLAAYKRNYVIAQYWRRTIVSYSCWIWYKSFNQLDVFVSCCRFLSCFAFQIYSFIPVWHACFFSW